MKALILAADGFEDLTLHLPWYRLQEAGVEYTLVETPPPGARRHPLPSDGHRAFWFD